MSEAPRGHAPASPTACDLADSHDTRVRWRIGVEEVDGPTHFRLGAALRTRYESSARLEGDFAAAVAHWQAALDADPNQYIWRRRIQQYGPRPAKPYPFYDWIDGARRAIRERGEEPVR